MYERLGLMNLPASVPEFLKKPVFSSISNDSSKPLLVETMYCPYPTRILHKITYYLVFCLELVGNVMYGLITVIHVATNRTSLRYRVKLSAGT
jgi:hypothetical protein